MATVSFLEVPGKAYKVCGKTSVFYDLTRVYATAYAAIVYGSAEGYYSVARCKWNYIRGRDVKSWNLTKGRTDMSWSQAIKQYNKLNEELELKYG